MKAKRKSGFTMIELLVVISIIGVLSAVLIPMVGDMMMTSKLSELGQKGSKIVKAIAMVSNSDGPYQDYAWPASNYEESDNLDDSQARMDKKFTSTEKYFEEAFLLRESDPDTRDRNKMLKGVSLGELVGDGMVATKTTTIERDNCSWAIAENMGKYAGKRASLPVLISKNLKGSALLSVKPADKVDSDKYLDDIKPFGLDGCVVVDMNGTYRTMTAGDMEPQKLMGKDMIGSDSIGSLGKGDSKISYLQTSGGSK